MLNIRHFTDFACQEEEIEDIRILRRIRAKRTAEDKQMDLDRSVAALNGEILEESDSAQNLWRKAVEITRRLSQYFGSRIIRRGVDSLDFEGKRINNITPLVTIDIYCLPTDGELEKIRQVRDQAALK